MQERVNASFCPTNYEQRPSAACANNSVRQIAHRALPHACFGACISVLTDDEDGGEHMHMRLLLVQRDESLGGQLSDLVHK